MTGEAQEGYVRVKVLGRGAFGQAVLYRKTETNQLIVWKEILLERLLKNKKNEREIENEIEVLRLLSHPNTIQYFNHYVDDIHLYIEMEYANGGTLYEKIVHQNGVLFDEAIVLWYAYQVFSALAYIHGRKILHRDIKTLNVFLTKSELVKIGDFGLSKVLEKEQSQAETNVGTPYYMSPELVKGLSYGPKSDVWAAGCVLHEMLTLEKTFMATNTLKIAANVCKGRFQPVPAKYTAQMTLLVNRALTVDPESRPMADELLNEELFRENMIEFEAKLSRLTQDRHDNNEDDKATAFPPADLPTVWSETSELFLWKSSSSEPQRQEGFETDSNKAVQVSLSTAHAAVVTLEGQLYTWNIANSCDASVINCGQLGHGNTATYRQPKIVSHFAGDRPVKAVSCGADFTVCLLVNGSVLTFGSNYYGCLGVGEEIENTSSPIDISTTFGDSMVTKLSCGDIHVLALTSSGECFSWGCGEYGRLGLGDEDDRFRPTRLASTVNVVDVYGGSDRSFFITATGQLLACGQNDEGQCGWSVEDVQLEPTIVKGVTGCVSVAATSQHTLIVTDTGRVYACGRNSSGELGQGDTRPGRSVPCRVESSLTDHRILRVACGNGFSLAASRDTLFTWGSIATDGQGLGHSSKGSSKSLPRAIFGTLSNIAVLTACNFTCAIVAERFTEEKHVHNSTNLSFSLPTGFHDADTRHASSADVPVWVQQELDRAEDIPINGVAEVVADGCPPVTEVSSTSRPTEDDLKRENQKLRLQVKNQRRRIEQLEATLVQCTCSGSALNNACVEYDV